MKNRMPRILVETTVKKALKSIKHNPERTARNLIDMALQLSDGRFQIDFFTAVQKILQDEDSAYYKLIRDVIAHVDTDKLYTFGINVGYNSCTLGAQRIRENEKVMGCNIPWTISVQAGTEQFENNQQKYDDLISEGESLGVYTWMLFVPDRPEIIYPLVKKHPDCAFCVFCGINEITSEFLEATTLNNLMIIVRYDENAADICAELRANKLLYSVWYQYGHKDTEIIINGDLFNNARQLSPVFTVLIPHKECPEEVRRVIHLTVKQTRRYQSYGTIAWELQGDNSMVDRIISDDACSVYFNKDGDLCDWEKPFKCEHHNMYQSGLKDILMSSCSKTEGECG